MDPAVPVPIWLSPLPACVGIPLAQNSRVAPLWHRITQPGSMPASRWHLLGGGVLIAIIGLLVIILTRSPETLYPVEINGRFGYINRSGKLVILAQFGDAGIFDNGLSPVLIGKTWGYVDKTGKIAIAPQFEVADPFSEG